MASERLLAIALAAVLPFVAVTPDVIDNVLAPAPIDYAVEGYDNIMCDSDVECEEATGYPYDVAITDALAKRPFQKYPRLVGHGCKGANGPIYAFEEDHFPKSDETGAGCREIVEMNWDWKKETN
jgi:hypothetical protein